MCRLIRALGPGLICLWVSAVCAQPLPTLPCSDPPPVGAGSCQTACVYCDFDGYTGINNGTPSGGAMVCNQINIHNDQWFGFVAGSASITINVATSNCTVGDGLQTAFFAACDAPALTCNPGGSNHAGLPLTMTYSNFVPGQTYYLMVDGFVADVCTYTIQVLNGSVSPPAVSQPAIPAGPSAVCPGATAVYSVPPTPGAGWYRWTAPPGATINGAAAPATLPAPSGAEVTVTFGTAGGTVCVEAGNACSPPKQACRPVDMTSVFSTVLPPHTVCGDALPYTWPEAPYTVLAAPGTYALTSAPYAAATGCDSTVAQTITVLPAAAATDLGVQYRCPGECVTINGHAYCDTGGPYMETLAGSGGCDSLVSFSVVRIDVEAVVMPADTLTCAQPQIVLDGAGSVAGGLPAYQWYDAAGAPLGQQPTLPVLVPGNYRLAISTTVGGRTCRDTATVVVAANLQAPVVAASGGTIDCRPDHAAVTLQATVPAGPAMLQWSGPGITAANAGDAAPTVTAPGSYSVVVADPASGCTATAAAVVTVDTVAPTVVAAGATLSCADTIVALTAVSGAVAPAYQWTGPGGFGASVPAPFVDEPGEYQLTVRDSANGCSASAMVTVDLDSTRPAIVLPAAAILTCLLPAVSLAPVVTPAGGAFQFSWQGPGIDSVEQYQLQQTVDQAGTFELNVLDAANGCNATAAVAVATDTLPPTVEAGPAATLNCLTPACTLQGASAGPAVVFSWSGPGITAAQEHEASPVVTIAGLYVLVGVDTTNGCLASDTTFVTQQTAAPAADAGGGGTLTCALSAITLGTPVAPGLLLTWTGSGIDSVNRHLPMPVVAVTGWYVVAVTDPVSHCTAVDSVLVSSNTAVPMASAGPDRLLTCASLVASLDGSASSTGPALRYTWSGPALPPGGLGVLSPVVTAAGLYVLTVLDTASQCSAADTVAVGQDTVPPVAMAGPDRLLTCAASTVTLDPAGSSAGTRYTWWWLGPGMSGSGSAPQTGAPGLYTLTVSDLFNGCTATDQVQVWPDTLTPVGFELDITPPLCHGEHTAAITVTGIDGGLPPFVVTLRDHTGNALAGYDHLPAGMYALELRDAAGCTLDSSVTIDDPTPLSVDLGPTTAIVLGDSLWLEAGVQHATPLAEMSWSPPAACAPAVCSGFWAYPTETYRQHVAVRDSNGCQAAAERFIIVEKYRRVYIPNAFAPDAGQNHRFAVYCGSEVERIRVLEIYDRWGEAVFRVQDAVPDSGAAEWDGRIGGRAAAAGVYVYRLEIVFKDGETGQYAGEVTLVK